MVPGGVLVPRRVEVTLEVTRRGEPLVTGLTLIRLDTFGLVRLIGTGPFQATATAC